MGNANKILVGKHERNRSFGRPRRRWENNTDMDFSEIGLEGVDWNHLAHDKDGWRALLNTVMNIQPA
jgi:hypothetical protein